MGEAMNLGEFIKGLAILGVPRVKKDSSGNTTGLVGPDGKAIALGGSSTPAAPRTSTTSETLALTDNNGLIRGNSTGALVYTIPNDATVAWPNQATISLYQMSTGGVSFAAGPDVTIRTPSGIAGATQYGIITALRINANEWVLA
jgi:hypothetical protein